MGIAIAIAMPIYGNVRYPGGRGFESRDGASVALPTRGPIDRSVSPQISASRCHRCFGASPCSFTILPAPAAIDTEVGLAQASKTAEENSI